MQTKPLQATKANKPVPPYSKVNARPKATTNKVVEVEIMARKVSGSVMQGNGRTASLFLPQVRDYLKNRKGLRDRVNGKGEYQLTR